MWLPVLFGLVGGASPTGPNNPNYPATLLDMRNDVKSRLDLPKDTPRAQFNAGGGNDPVLTSDQTITQYINERYHEFIRRCYPVYGTYTVNVAAGTRVVSFIDLTAGNQARMWIATAVAWNGADLSHTSLTALQRWKTDWRSATGTPTYYYEQGDSGVGFYNVPLAGGTVLFTGYVIPPRLVLDTDVSVIPPDLNRLLVAGAAGDVARKAWNNPDLQSRAPIWLEEFETGLQQQLALLWMQDPDFAKKNFEVPTPKGQGPGVPGGVMVAQGAAGAQQQAPV